MADFIGCKRFKAKGKRLTTCAVERIEELEPLRQPEPEPEEPQEAGEDIGEEAAGEQFDEPSLFTDI